MQTEDRVAYGADFVAEVTARLDAAGVGGDRLGRPAAMDDSDAVASNCGALPDGVPSVSNCG